MPTLPVSRNPVTLVPAAAPDQACAHFEALLALETDCADVHAALTGADPGFVLVDVRSPQRFAVGHMPGAINLPHRRISEATLADYPRETLFVVYCAGPPATAPTRQRSGWRSSAAR